MTYQHHEVSKENNTNVWLTPLAILEKLGPFDLDPCAAPNWPTAKTMFTEDQCDGYVQSWSGRVWLNPPFGKHGGRRIDAWMEKMARHNNGIAVTNIRTETQWFQRSVFPYVSGMFFFEGRIKFHCADGSIPKSSPVASHVLLAYGQENAEILSRFDWAGKWIPMTPTAAAP
jgi:hypothetical protein